MRVRTLAASSALVCTLVIASRGLAQAPPATALPPAPTFSPSALPTLAPRASDPPRVLAPPPPPPFQPVATSTAAPALPPPPAAAPSAPPTVIEADPPAVPVAAPVSDEPDDAPEPGDQLRAIGEPETDPTAHRYFPLNFSFLYPLATNIGDPNRSTNLDVGVFFTKIGYLYGLQTGVLASVSQEMMGVQLGVGVVSEGRTHGAQIGAAFALSDAPFTGLQVAGLFAWSRFHFTGIEIAGIANQARKHFEGIQIAGAVNLDRKTLEGVQIAGLMNIGQIRGLQLAPLNISPEVNGVQIGLVNIARKVKGLQIGLVNIADEVDGESIGMASIPKAGGVHGAAWGSNSLYGNFGIKFASRFTYSIFSGAFHFEGKDKLIGPGFSFGFYRPFLWQDFFVQADIGGYRLFLTEGPQRNHDEIYKTRLMIRYALVPHLSVFAGGGAFLGIRGASAVARFGPEFDAGLEL